MFCILLGGEDMILDRLKGPNTIWREKWKPDEQALIPLTSDNMTNNDRAQALLLTIIQRVTAIDVNSVPLYEIADIMELLAWLHYYTLKDPSIIVPHVPNLLRTLINAMKYLQTTDGTYNTLKWPVDTTGSESNGKEESAGNK